MFIKKMIRRVLIAATISMLCSVSAKAAPWTWVMIGDSYSSIRSGINYDGTSETLEMAWPDYLAASLGCNARIKRMGGHGFCRQGKQFITGLRSFPDNSAVTNIIVVGGIGNDCWCKDSKGNTVEAGESLVREKMLEFKKEAKKKFPNARIIYTAANWGETKARQEMCIRRAKMYRKIALELGWVYLSEPETALRVPQSQIKTYFFNDNYNGKSPKWGGIHPNGKGQQLLGMSIASAVRCAIPKEFTTEPAAAKTNTTTQVYEADPILLAKMGKVTTTSIQIHWDKVNGATKFDIYGSLATQMPKKIGTTRGLNTVRTQLKPGQCYRYTIYAYDSTNRLIAESKELFIATPVKNAKQTYTNCIEVSLNDNSVSLSKGRTKTVTASTRTSTSWAKRYKPSITYVSDTPEIASVSRGGIIHAKAKGTCQIYAISESGVYDITIVKVK